MSAVVSPSAGWCRGCTSCIDCSSGDLSNGSSPRCDFRFGDSAPRRGRPGADPTCRPCLRLCRPDGCVVPIAASSRSSHTVSATAPRGLPPPSRSASLHVSTAGLLVLRPEARSSMSPGALDRTRVRPIDGEAIWRRWTGIEPAYDGSHRTPALKAGEPTRYSDTSTRESIRSNTGLRATANRTANHLRLPPRSSVDRSHPANAVAAARPNEPRSGPLHSDQRT